LNVFHGCDVRLQPLDQIKSVTRLYGIQNGVYSIREILGEQSLRWDIDRTFLGQGGVPFQVPLPAEEAIHTQFAYYDNSTTHCIIH
jgi:hypothetical protein